MEMELAALTKRVSELEDREAAMVNALRTALAALNAVVGPPTAPPSGSIVLPGLIAPSDGDRIGEVDEIFDGLVRKDSPPPPAAGASRSRGADSAPRPPPLPPPPPPPSVPTEGAGAPKVDMGEVRMGAVMKEIQQTPKAPPLAPPAPKLVRDQPAPPQGCGAASDLTGGRHSCAKQLGPRVAWAMHGGR
jgi:hypothetical protein